MIQWIIAGGSTLGILGFAIYAFIKLGKFSNKIESLFEQKDQIKSKLVQTETERESAIRANEECDKTIEKLKEEIKRLEATNERMRKDYEEVLLELLSKGSINSVTNIINDKLNRLRELSKTKNDS